jgi:hypothetical protein
VRRALTLAPADIITELRPSGEAFILVPAVLGPQAARIVTATAGGAAVPIPPLSPLITAPPATIPPEIQAFVGGGAVIRLFFAPTLAVAAETDIELHVEVGSAAPFAQLKSRLKLRP